MTFSDLTLLKLGGSLITDKDRPSTPRREVLSRLAKEIAAARAHMREMKLIIGHGSGSFGHTAARKYGTRQGVQTPSQWLGFVEVWKEARALNEIVVNALSEAGLPVVAFPPSATVLAKDGAVVQWELGSLQAALTAGLVPLINGDVIFDEQRGGTILSTEDLFFHLALQLNAKRILLAGIEKGVWSDFPGCTQLMNLITPETFAAQSTHIGGSASVDVTGGMRQKVESMLALVNQIRGFEALVFSGMDAGVLERALSGAKPGTIIRKNG